MGTGDHASAGLRARSSTHLVLDVTRRGRERRGAVKPNGTTAAAGARRGALLLADGGARPEVRALRAVRRWLSAGPQSMLTGDACERDGDERDRALRSGWLPGDGSASSRSVWTGLPLLRSPLARVGADPLAPDRHRAAFGACARDEPDAGERPRAPGWRRSVAGGSVGRGHRPPAACSRKRSVDVRLGRRS